MKALIYKFLGLRICGMCGSAFDPRITLRKTIAKVTYCDHCVEAGREKEIVVSRLADDLMYIKHHPERLHELVVKLREEESARAQETAKAFSQFAYGRAAQQGVGVMQPMGWPRGGI